MQHDWTTITSGGGSILGFIITQVLILGGVLIFQPKPVTFITTVLLFSLLWEAIANYKLRIRPSANDIIKRHLTTLFYMILIIYVTDYFGAWGLTGLFIVILIICCILLYRRWDMYMNSIRKIESLIWGEPLDKKKR